MTTQASAAPSASSTSRRRWIILLVLAGSQMLVQLDATIINTAMPAIKRAFEMSEAQSLWVVDAYMVIFGGLLLLAGALGDRFGRRKILIVGMGIFVVASIAIAFSPDANFMIVGRGLQGLGGALVIPQTLSILTAVFPREERGRAIGIWAGAMGFGMAFGPLVGGVLVDLIGWAGVFWVPAPIAALCMFGMAAVPESRSQLHTKLDVPGAITGTIAMVAIVFAIIEGIQKGWTDPLIVGSFAVAIVSALMFIVIERRTDQPLLPMAFFKQRDFTGSMVGMFFIMFALMGVMFYLPQFFQLVQGMSASESGARLDAPGSGDDVLCAGRCQVVAENRTAPDALLGPRGSRGRGAVDIQLHPRHRHALLDDRSDDGLPRHGRRDAYARHDRHGDGVGAR